MRPMGNGAEGLLDRTRPLAPMLRERAGDAEVFKMCAPERFGGYEADFETPCEVLAEIGTGCGSTSWVATIFSAMA